MRGRMVSEDEGVMSERGWLREGGVMSKLGEG